MLGIQSGDSGTFGCPYQKGRFIEILVVERGFILYQPQPVSRFNIAKLPVYRSGASFRPVDRVLGLSQLLFDLGQNVCIFSEFRFDCAQEFPRLA